MYQYILQNIIFVCLLLFSPAHWNASLIWICSADHCPQCLSHWFSHNRHSVKCVEKFLFNTSTWDAILSWYKVANQFLLLYSLLSFESPYLSPLQTRNVRVITNNITSAAPHSFSEIWVYLLPASLKLAPLCNLLPPPQFKLSGTHAAHRRKSISLNRQTPQRPPSHQLCSPLLSHILSSLYPDLHMKILIPQCNRLFQLPPLFITFILPTTFPVLFKEQFLTGPISNITFIPSSKS